MSFNHSLKGLTTLVTGASSGLGKDFAKRVARQGSNLVIVARRKEELESLKAQIETEYKVSCDALTLDLTAAGATQYLVKQLPQVDVLINNAGFGLFGEMKDLDTAKTLNMLDLNMRVLTELTLAYLPSMLARNEGYILQVASIAAYQACPMYAAYGATKSYVLHFSESLHQELKGTNVKISTLCPGTTATEFFEVSGHHMTSLQKAALMKSEVVAEEGLENLFNRTASYIPGFHNRSMIFFNRLLPRSVQRFVVDKLMRST